MLRSVIAATLIVFVGGCGGGSGTGLSTSEAPSFTAFAPHELFSLEEGSYRLRGQNLLQLASSVRVRFRAESGTPFENGTRAFLTASIDTVLDEEIRGATHAGRVDVTTRAFVEVLSGDTVVISSDAPVVTFKPQAITGVSVASVSSQTPTSIDVFGTGFHAPTGVASVTFTPVRGSFLSGQGAVSTATVLDEGVLRVLTPPVTVLEPVAARLNVTLTNGSVLVGPSDVTVTFEPVPFVHRAQPAVAYAREPIEVTLTGFGFASEDPEGEGDVVVRLVSLLPAFNGGRDATLDVPGVVLSNGAVVAQVPATGVNREVVVNVQVFLGNGTAIASREALLQIVPQAVERVTPDLFTVTEIGRQIRVEGTGFTPGVGAAVLRLTTEEGTPFEQGTTDTVDIPLTISNHGAAEGLLPNLRVWADTTATATLVLASGLELAAPETVTFFRQYADFADPISLGTEAANGVAVADFDADQAPDLAFSHVDEQPYVHLNGGAGLFPEELREELNAGATRTVNAFDATRDGRPDAFFGAAADGGAGGGGDDDEEEFALFAAPEGSHSMFRNLGLGIFSEGANRFTPRSRGTLRTTRFADYDGDGDADAIYAYFGDGATAIEIWDANGFGFWGFASRPTDSITGLPDDVVGAELGDLNGDGALDIVVVSRGDVEIWRSTGRREFRSATRLGVRNARAARLADLDGDGDLDMLVATDANLRVFENTTPATFTWVERAAIPASSVNAFVLQDLDADGDLDLVLGRGDPESPMHTLVYDAEGAFVFADTGARLDPAITMDIALADVDRDGRLDIVQANEEGKRILFRTN